MSDNKKNDSVIYRCPKCLNTLNDVTIFADENGIYKCLKCGYQGDFDDLMKQYAIFRSRYKLMNKRITLEEQRNM